MKNYTALIFLLFCGCMQANHTSTAVQNKVPLKLDTSKYAILRFDTSENYYFDKKVKQDSLSNEDMPEVEHLLDSAITDYNKIEGRYYEQSLRENHSIPAAVYDPRIKDISNYKRQLIVVKNLSGEKIIWVNCFNDYISHPNWRKYIVSERGGGTWFFNLKINLTSRRVYDFTVNGPI